MGYFEADPALAFVQAKQRAVACPGNSFSADLSLGIDCLWDYLPLKNQFGLAPCFGHGVVIRRSALEAVGGFPEIVSEDLALTTMLREAGYFGVVASDIVCGEGVPRHLNQYRRRYEKWCVGIIEFARLYLRSFLRNKRIPLVEKLDLVFHCLNLLGMVPLFLFIVWVNIVLPFGFGHYEQLTIESDAFGVAWHIPVLSTQGSFSGVDSLFLRVVVLGGVLLPLSYFGKYFLCYPAHTTRHVAIAFTCFCATMVPTLLSMLVVLVGASPYYRSTADPWEDQVYTPRSSTLGLATNLRVGRIYSLMIETAIALCFLICTLVTVNLFLLSFALGALAGPLFRFCSWNNKWLAALKYLPFSLLVVQLILIGLPAIGYAGVFSHLVLIHF
jgi:cellulose synthase/poly-beta-1,6-N-acetylglucosamine synthase-like glycosyltransferase